MRTQEPRTYNSLKALKNLNKMLLQEDIDNANSGKPCDFSSTSTTIRRK